MSGEKDLAIILRSIAVSCDDKEYIYCATNSYDKVADLLPDSVGLFKENEATTVIILKELLQDDDVQRSGSYAKLTIDVHTSLEAVGLTAAMAKVLTKYGISANVVAAYYHDHIFVPYELKDQAIKALSSLGR
ncbi:MAG: ACT domain-containing protein [Candidatus Saccharimonadales bacterium]